ncbi:MAG: ABC transporter permease [Burkholderia sp.]|jgi:putative tryptophan/tyrosine transport system permease protein
MLDILIPTVAQGLMWSLLALGVFITFRVLDVADLTVEGSFTFGAAAAATALVSGWGVTVAFVLAGICGGIAGIVTGLLTTKLRIPVLLAGILTMIGLYSVNLHVMGKANVALLNIDTVFTVFEDMGMTGTQAMLAVAAVAAVLVTLVIYWFFGTELGSAVRATGSNPQMARAQGVNTDRMVVFGLCVSNILVGLSGALVAQSNGFADVGMGVGTIVIGLASVIIGEVLFGTRSFRNWLISVVLGSIVYRLVIAAVLAMGMPPNDLKLFTAILVAIALALPLLREIWRGQKARF